MYVPPDVEAPLDAKAVTGAVRSASPEDLPLALCMLAPKPPDGDGWLHEVKFDGYRLLLRLVKGRARVLTRTGADWTDRFPARGRGRSRRCRPRRSLLDGEAVVLTPGRALGLRRAAGRRSRPGTPRRSSSSRSTCCTSTATTCALSPIEDASARSSSCWPARQTVRRCATSSTCPAPGDAFHDASLRARARGLGLQARRLPLPVGPLTRLGQGEVPAQAGVRGGRLHRSGRLARRLRRAPARRAGRGRAALRRTRRHRLHRSAT